MTARTRWFPTGTRFTFGIPGPGDLFAEDHAVWRVIAVKDQPIVDDTDQQRWLDAGSPDPDTWSGRPRRLLVELVGGVRPANAHAGDVVRGSFKVPANDFRNWHLYPSGRWPQCSCCGEPMPCRAEMQDREITAGMAEVEKLAKRMPGCCWGCGEPITSRQKVVGYAGDNLDLPGGPAVRFHTRSACEGLAKAYELRWIAADPRRERILTYPACAGVLIVHADGSTECRPDGVPLAGDGAPDPECRGHLTHDHDTQTSCIVGDDWSTGGYTPCERGCRPGTHRGLGAAQRPKRRDHTPTLTTQETR